MSNITFEGDNGQEILVTREAWDLLHRWCLCVVDGNGGGLVGYFRMKHGRIEEVFLPKQGRTHTHCEVDPESLKNWEFCDDTHLWFVRPYPGENIPQTNARRFLKEGTCVEMYLEIDREGDSETIMKGECCIWVDAPFSGTLLVPIQRESPWPTDEEIKEFHQVVEFI
jgi:hypothetical protein